MFILAVICLLFWWVDISFPISFLLCIFGFLMIVSDESVKEETIVFGDRETPIFLVIGTAVGFFGIILFFRGMSEPFYNGIYGGITGWNIGLYFDIWYLDFLPMIAGLCAILFMIVLSVREYYVCRLLYLGGFLIALISQGVLIHGFYIVSLSNDISFGEAMSILGLRYGWVLCVIGGILVSVGAELIAKYGLPEEEYDDDKIDDNDNLVPGDDKIDKFCPYCGDTNPNGYNFCGSCRKELP